MRQFSYCIDTEDATEVGNLRSAFPIHLILEVFLIASPTASI